MCKLYIGCATPPFHKQHYDLFPDLDQWIWVDKYVQDPRIKNWDAGDVSQFPDDVEEIYASHLLEHIEHTRVPDLLKAWHGVLEDNGTLTINVPDMRWVAEQILKYESGQMIDSQHYYEWEGEHGMEQIIYGSEVHDGEYHKSGYTQSSLTELLQGAGFSSVEVTRGYDAHDMGILFAKAKK